MQLKPGMRLRSVADATEVIVVQAPADDLDVRCGGHPMIDMGDASGASQPLDPELAAGTELGKRYEDGSSTLELLCTKPGDGSLSLETTQLTIKDAKKLPTSD